MKQIIIILAILISMQLQPIRAQKWETIPKTEDVTSFFFTDLQNGWYVANYGMIYRTKDAGKTWKLMIEPGSAMGGENSKSTAVYSYNIMCRPREIFFLNSKMGWIVLGCAYGQVIRTTDGGNTWLDTKEFDKFKWFEAVYFSSEKNGWACGPFGDHKLEFFSTDDGGVTWKPMDVNLHMKALPEAEAETGTTVNDFNNISNEIDLNRIVFSDPQHGWVVGTRMVVLTKDGGKKWERDTLLQEGNYNDMYALSPDDCWYAVDNAIVHEQKGVKTEVWKDNDNATVKNIYFANPQVGYACGGTEKSEFSNDPDLKPTGYILQTTDGGKTWKNIRKENNIISGIQALPDKSILFGYRGGIIRLIP